MGKAIYLFTILIISVFCASLSFSTIMQGNYVFGMFVFLINILCIIFNSIMFYKHIKK